MDSQRWLPGDETGQEGKGNIIDPPLCQVSTYVHLPCKVHIFSQVMKNHDELRLEVLQLEARKSVMKLFSKSKHNLLLEF